jgi:hypothetical protein
MQRGQRMLDMQVANAERTEDAGHAGSECREDRECFACGKTWDAVHAGRTGDAVSAGRQECCACR